MQDQYPTGNASLFATAARGRRFFTEISPAEFYEAYKHEPELIAVADVYGFERRPCVEVRGTDDAQIAIIHPRYPNAWVKDFNAIVEHENKIAEARHQELVIGAKQCGYDDAIYEGVYDFENFDCQCAKCKRDYDTGWKEGIEEAGNDAQSN